MRSSRLASICFREALSLSRAGPNGGGVLWRRGGGGSWRTHWLRRDVWPLAGPLILRGPLSLVLLLDRRRFRSSLATRRHYREERNNTDQARKIFQQGFSRTSFGKARAGHIKHLIEKESLKINSFEHVFKMAIIPDLTEGGDRPPSGSDRPVFCYLLARYLA